MSEPAAPYSPPPAPAPFSEPGRTRRSMVVRHLVGAAIGLFVTPVGVLLFDYGAGDYLRKRLTYAQDTGFSTELVVMILGALVLLAVSASSRLSGLGPIIGGVVWGLVPLLWFLIDLASFYKLGRDLPSDHFWFTDPPFLFGLVAALLIGSGLGGRWRGRLK